MKTGKDRRKKRAELFKTINSNWGMVIHIPLLNELEDAYDKRFPRSMRSLERFKRQPEAND